MLLVLERIFRSSLVFLTLMSLIFYSFGLPCILSTHTFIEIFLFTFLFVISSCYIFRVFVVLLCFLLFLIQGVSIKISGDFIPVVALENIESAPLIITRDIIISIFVTFVAILFVLFLSILSYTKRKTGIFIGLVGIILIYKSYLQLKSFCNRSPILDISIKILTVLKREGLPKPPYIHLNRRDIEVAKNYGFFLNLNSSYPLIKDKTDKMVNQVYFPKGIIIVFAEGFPASLIGFYNGNFFKNLTPNIDDFASHALNIKNYYNHTASTYRGIQGQLCSYYPYYGMFFGWHKKEGNKRVPEQDRFPIRDIDYLCIPHIFSYLGYRTIFIDAYKNSSMLPFIARKIGFKEVYNGEDLIRMYEPSRNLVRGGAASDRQLFRLTSKLLNELYKQKEKFLIAIYNCDTHAFYNISRDGVIYGNGKNNTLNTVHTFDIAFGYLWQTVKNMKNILVILTSDHAHWQEESYSSLAKKVNPNYRPVFVDKIPFIIYDSRYPLSRELDAHYATSINFAPTLLDYLGIKGFKNSFMGKSILKGNGIRVSSFENKIFVIDKFGVHGGDHFNIENRYLEDLKHLSRFLNFIHYIEVRNFLWNKNLNSEVRNFLRKLAKRRIEGDQDFAEQL